MIDNIKYGLMIQEVRDEAVRKDSCLLRLIPDHLKAQQMYAEAVWKLPCLLEEILDHLKTQEMCDEAVSSGPN